MISLVEPRHQCRDVTVDVCQLTWVEIRELALPRPYALQLKSALDQHPRGCLMVRMAQRVQATDPDGSCEVDHRLERLGRVPPPPRIARKHIPRRRPLLGFKGETGAAKELPAIPGKE